MLLGTVAYTKPQLLSIFNQPAVGNGLISMAHQLITTRLNICNGSNPTNVLAALTTADALIGRLDPLWSRVVAARGRHPNK